MYFGGDYYPICENGFKNNNIGAKKVCQDLDFEDGSIAPNDLSYLEKKSLAYIKIGELSPEESGKWPDSEFSLTSNCDAVQVICLPIRKCRIYVDFVSIKVDYVFFFLDVNQPLGCAHAHT